MTIADIAAKVNGDSAGAGPPSGNLPAYSQTHSLVLLTDGEATDPEALFAARAVLAEPPLPDGGFRALLVSA